MDYRCLQFFNISLSWKTTDGKSPSSKMANKLGTMDSRVNRPVQLNLVNVESPLSCGQSKEKGEASANLIVKYRCVEEKPGGNHGRDVRLCRLKICGSIYVAWHIAGKPEMRPENKKTSSCCRTEVQFRLMFRSTGATNPLRHQPVLTPGSPAASLWPHTLCPSAAAPVSASRGACAPRPPPPSFSPDSFSLLPPSSYRRTSASPAPECVDHR